MLPPLFLFSVVKSPPNLKGLSFQTCHFWGVPEIGLPPFKYPQRISQSINGRFFWGYPHDLGTPVVAFRHQAFRKGRRCDRRPGAKKLTDVPWDSKRFWSTCGWEYPDPPFKVYMIHIHWKEHGFSECQWNNMKHHLKKFPCISCCSQHPNIMSVQTCPGHGQTTKMFTVSCCSINFWVSKIVIERPTEWWFEGHPIFISHFLLIIISYPNYFPLRYISIFYD
jgi:hypothetical protein